LTTAIAKIDPNAIAPYNPDAWNDERREFVRKNFCANAPDEFIEPFLKLCERRNLSPEANHIYLVPRWDSKAKRERWVPQPSIDGYRLIATRTGHYAGSDEPIFLEGEKHPTKATVTVYRVVAGVRCPFTASVYWDEFVPKETQAFMWNKMPHVMLAKVAEAQALRKAFPEDLSGLYTDDEMAQANTTEASFREVRRDPTPIVEVPQIASTTTESDVDDNPAYSPLGPLPAASFDDRIADALDGKGKDQKLAFRDLLKEAIDERDVRKIELLVKALPTYAEAENTMTYAFEKKGLFDGSWNAALKARDDAPTDFVDVGTGEIVDG
jgi:phage recombination protein Bet